MFGDLISAEENFPPSPGGGGRLATHIIAIAVAGVIIAVITGGVLLNDAMKGPVPESAWGGGRRLRIPGLYH